MRVYMFIDDIDRHGDCDCDLCDAFGKSYGCAIFDVTNVDFDPDRDVNEQLDEIVRQQDPLQRVYASSEEASVVDARAVCIENGWDLDWLDEYL